MMITLTFTTPFSVLGAIALVRFVRSMESYVPVPGSWSGGLPLSRSIGSVGFAILLVVLFSLNSGVASAAFIGGQSPSNVPWVEAQDSGRQIDIDGHAWVNDYGSGKVYGDYPTFGQTDWYISAIALETNQDWPYGEGLNKPRGNLPSLRGGPIEPGYILLLSHNIENQMIVRYTTYENTPLEEFDREFQQRDKIYSTTSSAIYYEPLPPNSTSGG
jgi:hypothetical protein